MKAVREPSAPEAVIPWIRSGQARVIWAGWLVAIVLISLIAVTYGLNARVGVMAQAGKETTLLLGERARAYDGLAQSVRAWSDIVQQRWLLVSRSGAAPVQRAAMAALLDDLTRTGDGLARIVVVNPEGWSLYSSDGAPGLIAQPSQQVIPSAVMAGRGPFAAGLSTGRSGVTAGREMFLFWSSLRNADDSLAGAVAFSVDPEVLNRMLALPGRTHRSVNLTTSLAPAWRNGAAIRLTGSGPATTAEWSDANLNGYRSIAAYRLQELEGLDTLVAVTDLTDLLRHDWWPQMIPAGIVLVALVVALTVFAFALRAGFRRIEKALRGAILLLARSQTAQDPYTGDHQSNVAELAVAIGRRLRLHDRNMLFLELGALIHDVGKLALPTQLLSKPGSLIPEEMALLRTHPVTGHALTLEARLPLAVTRIIRHHHEHWNGAGYPDALAGEAIPREAMIVSVADAVEAGTAHRPFRAAISVDEMMATLQHLSGRRFDPVVVDACLDVIAAGEVGWLRERADGAGRTGG